MARKPGYWIDANKLELIEIYDHVVFLSELEAKVRNELDLSFDEKRWAKSLGLKLGKGWGTVIREPPGARRERFMVNAMKAGWVRVRETEKWVTVELWGSSDSLMASVAWGLKKAGVSPAATLDIHDLKDNRALKVLADSLYARAGGSATKEQEAEVGFSAYSNPKKRGAKLRHRGSKREFTPEHNPGGDFFTTKTGHFEAIEPYLVHGGFRKNPATFKDFVDVAKGEGSSEAKLFLGLTRGLGKKRGQEIAIDEVVQFVKKVRTEQLPAKLPGGASFVTQRGFFTNWKKKHLHPDEDSVQILVYPEFDGGETLESYASNMKSMAILLANRFDQESVILNVVANGKLVAFGDASQE